MEDSSPKEPKENDTEELLSIALKWMKPGATAAVQLYAEPLRMPRDATLAQLRDAILEQTAKANDKEFHDLVANQKFQMHFVFKGTILKEEEEEEENDSNTLLELCKNAPSNNAFTLFVVLSNPPKPPKPPEVRPPARHAAVAEEEAAQTPAPPPDRRRPTTLSPPPPSLPAPFLEELQQQFPEHDIRDLVSTLLSSPDARAQMERSFDLQLAQLDHVPGGMSLLQSLYTQQQDQEERFLFSNSSNGTSSESHSANGSNNAAIAGATGQAMPNPWGNRNHNHRRVPPPPPRRTLPTRTSPALRSTAILPTRPNPWSNVTDDTEQLYETTTAATLAPEPAVTTTISADNPWRVNEPEAQEQLLVDMGFTNRARNRALLQQHDWDTTVDLLLQEQQPEEEGGAEDDDAAAAVQE